jgi:hypothetical protein
VTQAVENLRGGSAQPRSAGARDESEDKRNHGSKTLSARRTRRRRSQLRILAIFSVTF